MIGFHADFVQVLLHLFIQVSNGLVVDLESPLFLLEFILESCISKRGQTRG